MKYILSENQYTKIGESIDLTTIDPIYFLKKKLSKKPEVPNFDVGDSWEKKDEMQKYVDIMFKVLNRENKFPLIKKIEVRKISANYYRNPNELGNTIQLSVVIKPVVDSWVNPSNEKLRQQVDSLRKEFNEFKNYMGLGKREGYDTTEINFFLNNPN